MDNLIKRFKFDLEMGRFKKYHKYGQSDSYMFRCDERMEVECMTDLLIDIGFITILGTDDEDKRNDYNGIVIELHNRFFTECYISENNKLYNEVPSYIKEYSKKWKSIPISLKDFNLI